MRRREFIAGIGAAAWPWAQQRATPVIARADEGAAEIRVVTVRAGATVLEKVRPEFERRTGHKLDVVYDPEFVSVARRLSAGEPFDVYISSPTAIDGRIRNAKIDPRTRINLMHCGTLFLNVRNLIEGVPVSRISSHRVSFGLSLGEYGDRNSR
jgi:ABC-type molybdate transport system substrate-binding protein